MPRVVAMVTTGRRCLYNGNGSQSYKMAYTSNFLGVYFLEEKHLQFGKLQHMESVTGEIKRVVRNDE
ncbi:hypothetical protein C8J48_1612 [Desmospora activa DSM 45169]|uniref:Uncharacterized protein n=1 Tax=Desmospora activa DSM 45169 TaxID=1121389 RepID=A0A2T4ZAV2_9BACL|nr:hypothetical protein C8J48_1612 [Desmospora activa DSM 45169]